jgi:RNA polymerase sigma-70 factor (ECF subfamily)
MTPAMAELARAKVAAGTDLVDFSTWMASEQRRVFLLCLRLLRDRDEADSATQDAFLKAYRALERRPAGRELDSPERWLTRIAVNTCLDRLRSQRWLFWRRRVRQEDEESILLLTPAGGLSPHGALAARDLTARLTAALDRLSARQRAVFILRHHEDHSLEEIGTILGLDVGTVKAHMARALKKLREELRDLYGQPLE